MTPEHRESYWQSFLERTEKQEAYTLMTLDERRAFVDGWEAACRMFAHWDRYVKRCVVGDDTWDLTTVMQICEQARTEIEAAAEHQRKLRRTFYPITAGR